MDAKSLTPLPLGYVFAQIYRVDRLIGAGGMGAVYEVHDLATDRKRALKVMLPSIVGDADLRGRFGREARVTGGIESDHIVHVTAAGVDSATNMPFIVMDLLRGKSLDALLEARGRLTPREVVTYVWQAALGLDKAHAARVVHRDLKPDNLFLTARDDGSSCIKILDFGIAKVIADNSTAARGTQSIGTPAYMPPEQVVGDKAVSPASDVYALAHVAFTLLTGTPYFDDEAALFDGIYPLLLKIAQGAREPATQRAARRGVALPPAIDAWFSCATAAAPEMRFLSASAMASALAGALDLGSERPSGAPMTYPPPPPGDAGTVAFALIPPGSPTSPLRSPTWIAAALAIGIAVGATALLVHFHRSPPHQDAGVDAASSATADVASAAPFVAPPIATAIAAPEPPRPSAIPPQAAAAGKGRASVRPPSTTAAVAKPPAVGCDSPFTVDARGIKRVKPECL